MKGNSAEEVKQSIASFIKEDPYVTGGLVASHTVREWSVAVGRKQLDI